MEEQALSKIVKTAWTTVEKKKEKVEEKPVIKTVKKAKLKSQNTIMEEKALSEIIPKAWAAAEKAKMQK